MASEWCSYRPITRARAQCTTVERVIKDAGAKLLGWRDVPVKGDAIGPVARSTDRSCDRSSLPVASSRMKNSNGACMSSAVRGTERCAESAIEGRDYFHIIGLSSSTIVFKGLLPPSRSRSITRILTDSSLTSAMALVHSRFSTGVSHLAAGPSLSLHLPDG